MAILRVLYIQKGIRMHNDARIDKEDKLFLERHKWIIERLCLRASYGRDSHYCDMMQECYLTLLRRLPGRKKKMSEMLERAWVYWQCRSAIDCYRRKLRCLTWVPLAEAEETATASSERMTLVVEDIAAGLKGKERECFLLMAAGATDKELEQKLGLKHRSVVQMRHNIKKKIQEYTKK